MLVMFWEVQRLTRELNELQKQAVQKRIELSNYQKYSGVLGGTSVLNAVNIAGLHSTLVPRAMLFAQYSDQASSMSAMQNLQMQKMMGGIPYTGNPYTQMQLETSAFLQFKEQSLKLLKEQEKQVLHEKETELQLEMNDIETQMKMKEAMLESCKKKLSEEAQEDGRLFEL